jgi:hypothetical protein
MVDDGTADRTTFPGCRPHPARLVVLAGLLAPVLGLADPPVAQRKLLAATAATAATTRTPPPAQRHAAIDPALAADLLGWASRLSGLPNLPGEPLPRFVPLPQREIARTVCADSAAGCDALVAVYDTDRRRILYRNTLDMRDPTDQSFIVHELVHHLQFLQRGSTLFASCQSTLAGEAQAYRVQNLYQAHFRQWQRMGEVLRFMHCEDNPAGEPVARLFGMPLR